MSSQSKKNTFYGAAALLTVTTIVVKIIGAIYKIPLTALLPDEAYGDFGAAYNIYSFFLTISTAGLPVALSKTVSECNALGRENQKERVFRMAFCAFLFMGVFSFICMSVFSQFVATHVLQNEKAVYAVLALAPAVLCTCICSAFRGYAQGHMNMVPTGISQIIEALCKLLLGLGLALLILRSAIQPEDLRDRLSAAGALLGVSIGSILSVIYLFFNHRRTRQRQKTAADVPEPGSTILARLLKLAIPITLSSCTMSLVTLIDTNLVNGQLQNVFTSIQGGLSGISNSFLDIFPKSVTIFQNNLTAWQEAAALNPLTELNPVLDSTRSLYGAYQKTMSIYNLPFNLMVPFTACIVPGISACLARRDRLGAQRVTESAMRISALIALPCGFGLFALGGPIIQLLTVGNVDASIAGPLLSILGIASIFVCIQVVAAAILQANGIVNLPIINHGHRRRHQAGHQLHAGGQPEDHDLRRAGGHAFVLCGDLHPQSGHHQADGPPAAPVYQGLRQALRRLRHHGGRGLGLPRAVRPFSQRQLPERRHGHGRRHPGGRSGICNFSAGFAGHLQRGPGTDAQG